VLPEFAERVLILSEKHQLIADLSVNDALANESLLIEAGLLHEHPHAHGDIVHTHLHAHEHHHEE
jgi:cobalt/nickel transport system ATP-binding protein